MPKLTRLLTSLLTPILTAVRSALRPSLRRRVALTLGSTLIVEFFVLAGAAETVDNMVVSPGDYQCYGPTFPALPQSSGNSCSYTAPITVLGMAVVVVVLLLVAWSWWLLAGWVLRPLSATTETVRRLGPHNLGQRIRLAGGPDALKDLADALDDALDRLAGGYESQRRFAANASHELRTPLAVQRLLTEVAMEDPEAGQDLRRLGSQLLRTNEHNEQLIEGLLVLAESDRGVQGRVPLRLDELARTVLDTHRELAERHGIALREKLAATVIPGEQVLLERLVANLVSNGIKYNEPGGWVEVEVTAEPALVVRNTGPQVPARAVPTLFEPFKRLGTDRVSGRGGAGLGLAIVRSIVIAHEGTISARPRPEGGLEVEVGLPSRIG